MVKFSKTYSCVSGQTTLHNKFDRAWEITCDYEGTIITTCDCGCARIEGDLDNEADAIEMEARLDKVFS